jgi:CheY-like chemotaxis protein
MDRIMIVDDEPDIVNLVRMILEKEGYWVSTAYSGDEALQKIDKELPDLILLDLVMPGKSGLEVCKTIRTEPKTKNTVIVMFTALGRDVDKRLSQLAGADSHFTKPFEKHELISLVGRCINDARLSQLSRQMGIDHTRMLGRKILLEFDPQVPYEGLIRDFVTECLSNHESIVIITRNGSPIRHDIEGCDGVRFIELEPTLRFSPILSEHPEGPLCLVLDSLTDFAMFETSSLEGYKATYKFAQHSLQVLGDPRVTALFLLNPSAHPPHDVAGLRGIFSNQIVYDKRGLTAVKLESAPMQAPRLHR